MTLLLCSSVLFLAVNCKNESNTVQEASTTSSESGCFVELFDGDNYTDDQIKIEGPAEYTDLKNLPGSKKDWTDEADSFKSGKNTTVTFYTKTGFQGDSITYKGGENKPSMDEPSSMKIKCN